MAGMADVWNVLIVDDDKDIHLVTKLALKHLRWKDKKIQFTHAYSAKEAQELLLTSENRPFEVAMVDVVMENEHAGLDVCKFIRSLPTRTTRIILRTGQPGSAPQGEILEKEAIDYYLAKTAASSEQMASVIRACLQASEDIRVLEAAQAEKA
jgi:CheY-like chemotaxis protein